MIRKTSVILCGILTCTSMPGQDSNGKVNVYGEVNNYASYSTRNGIMDESGLLYLLPADQNLNEVGMDLNNSCSARFLSIATKLGVSWDGFKHKKTELGAKVEADFYFANGVNTLLRLRKAYFTAAWNFVKWNRLSCLVGQNWHPFAIDQPHTLSMTCGAPFNPYSFAPQLLADYRPLKWMSISAGALWQMDYRSTGPIGYSSEYIAWSCIPEIYAGLNFFANGFRAKLGFDMLTIKPRRVGTYLFSEVLIPVTDKLVTYSGFAYLEYSHDWLSIKAKGTYLQSGEHMTMFGGYFVSGIDDDGNMSYTPFGSAAGWLSMEGGRKLKGSLMLGYMQRLPSAKEMLSLSSSYVYYRESCLNLSRAFRVTPGISYTFKHIKLGIEYEFMGAQYGSINFDTLTNGLAMDNLHFVFSHRITALAACMF